MAVQVAHRSAREVLQDLADCSQPRFVELMAPTTAPSPAGASPAASVPAAAASWLGQSLALLPPTQQRHHVEAAVLRVVRELTGAPAAAVTAETPLMDAGIDSLAATELSSRLRNLTGVALSPTIVFEEPTPRAIAAHLVEQAVGAITGVGLSAASGASAATRGVGASLAVDGAGGQWSGGCDAEVARAQLLHACGDAVGSVPATRWTLALAVEVQALTPVQTSCVRHGGFVAGAQRFDCRAFGVSPAEAGAMDPQQRLLLERGYEALHVASHRRATLMGGDGGAFLGIERPDWAMAQPPAARCSVYALTGDNVSVSAGRLSFVLGMQGPCSSVDTACASSLVAAHGAGHAVNDGECSTALAMAVSLKLVPHGTLGAAAAGMLSVDGRCKTLDARANGYARSEGIGSLVVRLSVGVGGGGGLLASCAVRQDGRSASLTAPNGSAQRTLLLAALARAARAAGELACIEAHGTGTALGDPTEMGALAAVHGTSSRASPLVLGAAKASVGHAEAASGQVGLLKVLGLLEAVATGGSAQLRLLNPLVGERLGVGAAPRFGLATQTYWVATCSVVGVSSFGYSGTIAHACLQHRAAGKDRHGAAPPSLEHRPRAFPWREDDAHSSSAPAHTSMYAACWALAPASGDTRPRSLVLVASRPSMERVGSTCMASATLHLAVLLLAGGGSSAPPSLRGMHLSLALGQLLARHATAPRVLMLTCGTLGVGAASHAASDAAQGGAWGFARVLRLEQPALGAQSIDVSRGEGSVGGTLSSSIWPCGRERDGLLLVPSALSHVCACTPSSHNPLGPGNCVQYVCHHRRSRWPGSSRLHPCLLRRGASRVLVLQLA